MKCEDCKHWTYERMKSYKRYGKCVGMFPDKEVMVYFDFECPQFSPNKKAKFMGAYEKMVESIRIGWGI